MDNDMTTVLEMSTGQHIKEESLESYLHAYYATATVAKRIENACGVGAGYGPWACPNVLPCDEHQCRQCGGPAKRLCSFAGQFVCGAVVCDDEHHSERNH